MGFYVDRSVVFLVSTGIKPVFQAEYYGCGTDFSSRSSKVKFTIEQATKAQRWSSGIVLFFL
jgi:hypothetical protein